MINITLPDGNIKSFNEPIDGITLASNISIKLKKNAIAMKVNHIVKDLTTIINEDCAVDIITAENLEGMEIIRHDAAHILAHAVKELYPDTQIAIGPAIENGFYYDFARNESFSKEDLIKIESKMKEIITADYKIERKTLTRNAAIEYFSNLGENYKVELINSIPEDEEIIIYSQGNFTDLCQGPHSTSTGKVKAFKLMKLSGAYWRGDNKNQMLQRIYGTAWADEKQLKNYLHLLEEAEKRDHRKIGKEMDLFHFQEEAPGAVFWHPNGWSIFQKLIDYMRSHQKAAGYLEINTPEIIDRSLWEASGHWEKFGENMFTAHVADDRVYAVKPMNCPGCIQVFKHGLTSYKELPMRLAEFGKVHRFEPSGSLHGLMRVRAFTQDDAHVFCTEEQINEECKTICKYILNIYKDFGFDNIKVKFSDRPIKRIGSNEIWDKAENSLLEAVKSLGLEYTLNTGEGAFYGPKLEFTLTDAINRDWQIGTLQVDLNLPVRLGATYIDKDTTKQHPVMLHIASFGSFERFIGILLEHYAGKLPLWLIPIQIAITTIVSDANFYAEEIFELLTRKGFRSILDTENNTLNYKIRKHFLAKVPVIIVLGKQEVENRSISVRMLDQNIQQQYSLDEFVNVFSQKAKCPSELVI